MRRLALVVLAVLGLLVPMCIGEVYPRHIDPSLFDVEQPDPEMLFLLYHEIYLGMINKDFKISKEWLKWALEILTIPDLEKLLNEYGGLLDVQADNLNFTSYYFKEALTAVSRLQIARARTMLVQGLVYLEASSSTMPQLYDKTSALERLVRAHPQILYDDLALLEKQIQEYRDLAELIRKYFETGELSQDEKDFLLEQMRNLISDTEYDEFLDQYLKEFFSDPQDIGSLKASSLTLEVNQTRIVIGQYVRVSGVLGLDDEVGGRRIRLVLDGKNVGSVYTGEGGYYGYELRIPFVYRDVGLLWAEYWPEGPDVRKYLPAKSNVVELELVHFVPELVVEVDEPALPGETLKIWGQVTYSGVPLEVGVSALFLGVNNTDTASSDGEFSLGLTAPPSAAAGEYDLAVRTHPSGVYGSAWIVVPVEVKRYDMDIDAFCSELVLSGMSIRVAGRVSAGGLPLDGCHVRLIWGGNVATATSIRGEFDVGVRVPFWTSSQASSLRLEASPREAYIDEGAVSLETRIINTGSLAVALVVSGSTVYLVSKRKPRRKEDAPVSLVAVEVEEEPPAPVDDLISLYRSALLVIQRITGYGIRSSETIREYLGRVKAALTEKVYSVFEEASLMYERWLYGKPFELSLDWFRSLVDKMRGDHDEE